MVVCVYVWGVVADEFDVAFAGAFCDEVEVVRVVAVREGAGGLDVAVGGPAVPCVDVVVGVVCHEGKCSVCKGEDGGAMGFAEDCSAGDAAALGEDVVCEDGEVCGDEGVLCVVIGELVEASGSAFAVEESVCGGDGGDVCGADAAVVDDACGGWGDGTACGGLDYPLSVFCAELDGCAA